MQVTVTVPDDGDELAWRLAKKARETVGAGFEFVDVRDLVRENGAARATFEMKPRGELSR
jgi:hypothetical protein